MTASRAGVQGVEGVDQNLTKEDVAALLRVSVHTLARWRCEGKGPRYVKLGTGRTALIRYPRSAIETYLAGAARRSTVDPGEGALDHPGESASGRPPRAVTN
jgi:hypothetical protein